MSHAPQVGRIAHSTSSMCRCGRSLIGCFAALLLGTSAMAADAPPFVDGDRVAFIGDSITHSGSYHAYVYAYYLTRFPQMRLTILNCGISGDSAYGASNRTDWDILPGRPTVATIMLGMNDVGRDAYGLGEPTPEQTKRRADALAGYRANMQRLISQLRDKQIKLTLITPSPYDQTATLTETNLMGVNDALAACGQYARETAAQLGLGLVDFNGQLTALNAQYQQTDPARTLIGADRVHPGELGHLLMAYYFLRAQGMESAVASMEIDSAKQQVTQQARCTLSDLSVSAEGLRFTYLAQSLPYPYGATYQQADALIPFTQHLNQELLAITALPDGQYELRIDDALLGSYSAAAFAEGVNLAINPSSPMQRQAQAVQAKNMERHSLGQQLRTIAMLEAGMHQGKVDPSDPPAVQKHFEATRLSIQGKPWESYINNQIDAYAKLKPREEEISQAITRLEQTLYTLNRPTAHTIEIRRQR